jgi:elongation factor Ts
MDITSELIKQLRDKTGAGMMDCKRALESTGGNMDAAVEYLRKKGAAVAAKRADRAAKEGVIVTRVSPDARRGVMVEINCETDFVGRSDDFTGFAAAVAAVIDTTKPSGLDALLATPAAGGKTVAQQMNDLLAKVGEKVEIRRFEVFESADGAVASYTHLGNKIGVLVELGGAAAPQLLGAGRDVAMQIAAMNPMVIGREQVPADVVSRELDIYKTQAANEGKPAPIVERIAQGRLEKFYQEVALSEQTFIKDSGKNVRQYLEGAAPGAGIRRFRRFLLGEEGA